MAAGRKKGPAPVFVIFVPSDPDWTCDATWWLKARREQKATDAEGAPRRSRPIRTIRHTRCRTQAST